MLFPTNACGLGYKLQRPAQKSSRHKFFKRVGIYNCSSSRHRTSQTVFLGGNSKAASLSSSHLLRRLVETPAVMRSMFPLAYTYREAGSSLKGSSEGRKCRGSPMLYILWTVLLCSRKKRGRKKKKGWQLCLSISKYMKLQKHRAASCKRVSQAILPFTGHDRAWAVHGLPPLTSGYRTVWAREGSLINMPYWYSFTAAGIGHHS